MISTTFSRAGLYLPGYDSYQGLASAGVRLLVCSHFMLSFYFLVLVLRFSYIFNHPDDCILDLTDLSCHSKRIPKIGVQGRLSLNAGQK